MPRQQSAPAAFHKALDTLIAQVRDDRAVLAAVLCGSLSHDTVWAKSDIDLILVTIDDRKAPPGYVSLDANGVNVHACMMPRAEFRRLAEGSLHNSFMHSYIAKGRLLFTHDPALETLFASVAEIGRRDTEVQLLAAASAALPPLYKAHKWMLTRGDLDYTALWILYAATPLARIEIVGRRLLADREVLPQATALNPAFFDTVYTNLLNTPKTRERVQAALDAADAYLAARAPDLFRLVLDYLDEAGEARSCSEMQAHFERTYGISDVTTACEYLSDQQMIGKASTPLQLTRRSTAVVQELAFFALPRASRPAPREPRR